MPIEIKELHIRVSVNTPQGTQSIGIGTSGAGGDVTNNAKNAIVVECVEQVLQILEKKAER
jgi:hypothetical protein